MMAQNSTSANASTPRLPNVRQRLANRMRSLYFRHTYRLQQRMGWHPSFAQLGEDLIALRVLNAMGIKQPRYLDIGAFDPYRLSNTAIFYLSGCRGINIEPNPQRIAAFMRERPRDINLNIGVAATQGTLDYYEMSTPMLNTFSKESAEEFVGEGATIIAKRAVPVWTLENVVGTYCQGRFPEFLSLDVEGMDMAILASIDYEKAAPIVICVETLNYAASNRNAKKNHTVINFLQGKGYLVYADTQINTLFVKESLYLAR